MSKRFQTALLWAVKINSSTALDGTINKILSAGYGITDIENFILNVSRETLEKRNQR